MSDDNRGSRRRRRIGCAVAAAVMALLLCIVAALAIGPMIDASLASELEERGITCDPLSVDLALSLDAATLAPTRCRLEEGPVSAVRFPEGVTVELEGLAARSAAAPAIEVELRPTDGTEPEASVSNTVLASLAVGSVACTLLSEAAWLARRRYPDLRSERVTLSRGGSPLATLSGVSIDSREGHLGLRVDRMELSATSAARFSGVQADLTPATADARGRVDISVDLGFTEVGHGLTLGVTAAGLDTADPTCELSASDD